MNSPGQPTGQGEAGSYFARLEAWCRSGRLLPGVGYRLKQYAHGVALEFPQHGGVGKAAAPDAEYIFQSHGDDYILCVPSGADPNDPRITPTKIKKPYLLRFSILQRTVQGQLITYSNFDLIGQSRVATNALGNMIQVITPQYAPGDIIVAGTIGGSLQDRNPDGRVFAGP